MDIAVVGTGYVGLVSAVCFADQGHNVIGVDIDEEKVAKLKRAQSPIYEPGLDELLLKNIEAGRLHFTTDLLEALPRAKVVFCAVATPSREDYSADVRAVLKICETVAESADHDIVFVNKSTVPVGTGKNCAQRAQAILQERDANIRMAVVSNPEFLQESTAIENTMNPDRTVIGINGEDDWARAVMEELYEETAKLGAPIVFMSRESAEIVKYASNGFLATKISFINMISELCEVTGADVRSVAEGMGFDDRIGQKFLRAGIGYGGSCFPKDVRALIAMSRHNGAPLPIANAVHDINMRQRARFTQKLLAAIPRKSTVAVWGLTFKPNTDDMREAPSVDVVTALLEAGHKVQVFDPQAERDIDALKGVTFFDDPIAAVEGAHAIALLTEWDECKQADLAAAKAAMPGNMMFDGRNALDPEKAVAAGFVYEGVGVRAG